MDIELGRMTDPPTNPGGGGSGDPPPDPDGD